MPTHDDDGWLDVMLSREEDGPLDTEVIDVSLSDHRLVCARIDFTPPQPVYETITSRAGPKLDIGAFRRDLQDSVLCNTTDHTSKDPESL